MPIKETILQHVDVLGFYSEIFPGWNPGTNVSCPFAKDRHENGTDYTPSFSINIETGAVFCHACNFKASSPIGFYESYKGVTYQQALDYFKSTFQPIIKPFVVMNFHNKLLANKFIMNRLITNRGFSDKIIKQLKLGWSGNRLCYPIYDEKGNCVNIRQHDVFKWAKSDNKTISWRKGYGQPRLWPLSIDKNDGQTVYICEGESDTVLALSLGLNAKTITGGATTFPDAELKHLKGKDVIIIPDTDSAGNKGLMLRSAKLSSVASSIKVIALPCKKPYKDFTDWIMCMDGKIEDLPKYYVEPPKVNSLSLTQALDMSPQENKMVSLAEHTFERLSNTGKFFRNGELLYYMNTETKRIYRVDFKSHSVFASYLLNISPLINQAIPIGKFVAHHVQSKAWPASKEVTVSNYSIFKHDSIFVAIKNNGILKVSNSGIKRLNNGTNMDQVLMQLAQDIQPFNFIAGTQIETALNLLWNNMAKFMAVSNENKYLLLCWIMGLFVKEYTKPKPVIRLIAKTASGKSTLTKLLSVIIYGKELLHHSASTMASVYEMASMYPVLLFDNIETKNINQQFEDFILTVATGGLRAKRKVSTDTGVVIEHANCLVLTNGIEPLSKQEVISRTIEVPIDLSLYGLKTFSEHQVFSNILKNRDQILSGVLTMFNRHVIPTMQNGKIQKHLEFLSRHKHAKDRFNEYLSLMLIILEALWPYKPLRGYLTPKELMVKWLDSFNDATPSQESETNDVVYFLDTLISRASFLMGIKIKITKTPEGNIEAKATTSELLSDFRLLAKYLGIRCIWNNERQLGTRLVDSESALKNGGWLFSTVIISGRKTNKFTKGV